MKQLNPELGMPFNFDVEQVQYSNNKLKSTFSQCNDENLEELEQAVNQMHKKVGEKIQTEF